MRAQWDSAEEASWHGAPLPSGMPPTSSMSTPRAGQASAVLLVLLLQLCDPVLLMEGMDMTKGGTHTFIIFLPNYTLEEP